MRSMPANAVLKDGGQRERELAGREGGEGCAMLPAAAEGEDELLRQRR